MEETFDHEPGIEKDQVSPICRYGMNLGDFQTPSHDDTQGRTDMITGENRRKELKNICMNFSSTCRQKPERQCSLKRSTASVIRGSMGKKIYLVSMI